MFISFEGIEGSGKSTAQRLLAEHLQGLGYDPLLTREPGGCALGRSLRPILLDARTRGLSSRAELYLFLADRAQHVAEVIRPGPGSRADRALRPLRGFHPGLPGLWPRPGPGTSAPHQ